MVNYTVCPGDTRQWSDTYATFGQLVNGVLTTLCVVLGSIGNIHSIKAVHFTNFDKNRGVGLAVSLLALAIWDTILLWCAFFYYGMKSITKAPRSDMLNLLTPFFHAFSQIANTASVRLWIRCRTEVLNDPYIFRYGVSSPLPFKDTWLHGTLLELQGW